MLIGKNKSIYKNIKILYYYMEVKMVKRNLISAIPF